MITKLTAENAELYYAPRFAEITAALQAAGKDIEIRSLEDYFLYLTDIAELKIGAKDVENAYLLVLPADEEIFAIDANSRTINIPAFVKKNGIGVYGDHHAEMIVMTVDRYFDHEDFLNDKIVINWNFTPAGSKIPHYEENKAARAFAPNEELNPGKITFGFIITKEMTPQKGTLTFSVTIYDDKSGDIVYSFNTLTASVAINDTLTLTDLNIIENDTDNYVGRLTNSVYTNNTISPVGTPVWKSGELINNEFTGLDATAYFKGYEDLNNEYNEGALLTAYATVEPNTADVVYKWTFNPVDGTVATGRNFETVNIKSDYVERDLPVADDGSVFYQKTALDEIDTTNPLTWTEAKELADAVDESDTRPFLPLTVKKVAASEIDNADAQFNQEHIAFAVTGNQLYMSSTTELRNFEIIDGSGDNGEWVVIDIDTGLESIIGAFLGDQELTENDELEAAALGLSEGHIAYLVKADVVEIASRNLTISATGYKPTPLVIKYTGVDAEYTGGSNALVITNRSEAPVFYVRGTSYRALSAGNYQVVAQARIQAGPKYEKVLDGATLHVNTEYYVKVNDEIDTLNPIMNADAKAAQDNGLELYTLISAARNSAPVESSVLSVPPAVQPNVVLSVDAETKYEFNDEVAMDPDFTGPEYVYIDNTHIPRIIATVTVPSEDQRDSAGAFAAQLVQSSEAAPTLEQIEQKIADQDLNFISLPSNGEFAFEPTEIEEGEYVVRAINRRNGTYSISENSDSITTKFVAPEIKNITLFTEYNDIAEYLVLDEGRRPDNMIVDLPLNKNHTSYDFTLVDNSNNFEEAVVKYFIEEVDYDEDTGVITPRTPDENGNNPETGQPYEPYGQDDIDEIEPIQDENDNTVYRFTISNDPGYYRIKTLNRYYGTIHTSYTDVFGISSH